MKEIRFHGRGGQGAVTAAELFAQAAISSELYAQGFPNFGAERRGGPCNGFPASVRKPDFFTGTNRKTRCGRCARFHVDWLARGY